MTTTKDFVSGDITCCCFYMDKIGESIGDKLSLEAEFDVADDFKNG